MALSKLHQLPEALKFEHYDSEDDDTASVEALLDGESAVSHTSFKPGPTGAQASILLSTAKVGLPAAMQRRASGPIRRLHA